MADSAQQLDVRRQGPRCRSASLANVAPAGCGPPCVGQRRTSVPCDARDIVSWINHFVRAGRRDGMNAKLSKLTPILFAGVAAAGIAVAPSAFADPEPPPPAPPAPGCYNPDGTPCTPSAGPQGAGAEIPGGPGALARSDGHVSAGTPVAPGLKRGRVEESRAYQAVRAEPSPCPDNASFTSRSARGATVESPLAPNSSEGALGPLTLGRGKTYKPFATPEKRLIRARSSGSGP
ncbi:hypothetical protein PICSAR240_03958 [Mycobacterium avium subsp. paratuberculosis]|nr:hypothetical protein B0172_01665 [Mycobacterium avium subsp. paratuberculosis]OVF05319.1 hypothetical protein B0173_01044 [Mycobacterium avium subsp. paratuberculosis]CAG6852593.1 hypothetical protein PICSAR113_00214 [Mycobacterium avium subsp. paratuberculosis]CAG6871259.1 hypothetical protein PICSAR111_01170 [Mycobacterium avium subsp. paratuberculosis]CAG6873943.1 hypothetical protein PICSAR106_01299 [Mycobacterium avium subsp. paratuberculosis]